VSEDMADHERIDFSKISFLVVEPNRLMGQMVRDVLQMLDVQYIDRARDFETAVNVLRMGRTDIMITEWALSQEKLGRNGMDIVHWVRNDGGSPNRMMPIVMMTANSESANISAPIAAAAGLTGPAPSVASWPTPSDDA
jgi:two-component system chemotaxis response regulator CheY